MNYLRQKQNIGAQQSSRQSNNQVASLPGIYGVPRPFTADEIERMERAMQTFKNELKQYESDKAEILANLELMELADKQKLFARLNKAYLFNRTESKFPEFDKFFRINAIPPKSVSGLKRLESALGWYEKSGDGKKLIAMTLADVKATAEGIESNIESIGTSLRDMEERDKELVVDERNSLGQITELDEEYFRAYLKSAKPTQPVFRGDGRGIDEKFLDNYRPVDVIAGGATDISFYGVVQHTHSSVNKNGMVSTTTEESQAKEWAMDGHNWGVVYEFDLHYYIHVADLLAKRNFKDRFAAQKEVLVPGNIPANAIVSVSLYKKEKGVEKLVQKKTKANGWQ